MERRKYWYIFIVANVSNKLVVSVFKKAQEDCFEEGKLKFIELSVTHIPTNTATYLRKWKSSSKMLEDSQKTQISNLNFLFSAPILA
jgi:hypothetical protein